MEKLEKRRGGEEGKRVGKKNKEEEEQEYMSRDSTEEKQVKMR